MSFAHKSIPNPNPVAANGCLSFVSKISSYSHSYPPIPVKFQLCCAYSSSLPLPTLFPLSKKLQLSRISVIAAQEEENNPLSLDEQIEVEEEVNWDAGKSDGYEEELSEEAKVYVGNLPFDVDSENLAKLFDKAGVVEIAEIIFNRETDRSRGFGFVTMSTVEEAEKAVEMFHRYEFNGRLLTVSKASPKGSRPERPPRVFEPACKIYVANLPWSVDDARLKQVFSEYGTVMSAQVVSDRDTGRSRGFGFVVMSNESEMNDAISNLDGQSLDGRLMRVNVAEVKARRSQF